MRNSFAFSILSGLLFPYAQSGFFMKGEVKHIERVQNKNGSDFVIVAINNDSPQIFKLNE